MGNLVFGSGAEPGRASKARGGLTESPMERYYDATESDIERYRLLALKAGSTHSRTLNYLAYITSLPHVYNAQGNARRGSLRHGCCFSMRCDHGYKYLITTVATQYPV